MQSKNNALNIINFSDIESIDLKGSESYIFDASYLKSKLIIEFSKDFQSQAGIQTMFWPKFNNMIGGQRPGELVIILADTGIGKTTFAMNWCADTIQQGQKALYISLENSPMDVAMQIAQMLAGIRVDKPATKDQLAKLVQNIDAYFKNLWFYAPDIASNEINLLKAILWAKKNKNCSTVILDHFDAISINRQNGDGLVQSQTRFLNEFRRFLDRVGMTCIGIVHPAKSGDKGGYKETKNRADRQIMIDEIKGSSSFKQVADIVLSLNRPSDLGGRVTTARLEKIRKPGFGKIGDSVNFLMGAGFRFREEGIVF